VDYLQVIHFARKTISSFMLEDLSQCLIVCLIGLSSLMPDLDLEDSCILFGTLFPYPNEYQICLRAVFLIFSFLRSTQAILS